jgi:hypothetical protein
MQLESSVFGVCIIQIKPQLEKLLGLPNGALTKEIQLTQDLMSLFVDYQVPSDLMTFDGPAEYTLADKLEAVKEHVESIKTMIASSKESQLKNEIMKAGMRTEMSSGAPMTFGAPSTFGFRGEGSGAHSSLRSAAHPPGCGVLGQSFGAAAASSTGATGLFGSAPAPEQLEGSSERSSSRRRLVGGGGPAPPTPSADQLSSAPSTSAPALKKKGVQEKVKSIKVKEAAPSQQVGIDSTSLTVPSSTISGAEDFTMIPKALDAKLEELELDLALRSTVIKASSNWTRTRQENFLTTPATLALTASDIATERKKALDLLDAISRSGTLAIDCSELHVFVAVSHCFDNDVLGTVVQDNINPIVKVERSSLLLASTIHGPTVAVPDLIQHEPDRLRLQQSFPRLFALTASEENGTANGSAGA